MKPHEKAKAWRVKRGLTQAQLSDMSGYAIAAIYSFERGDRSPGIPHSEWSLAPLPAGLFGDRPANAIGEGIRMVIRTCECCGQPIPSPPDQYGLTKLRETQDIRYCSRQRGFTA